MKDFGIIQKIKTVKVSEGTFFYMITCSKAKYQEVKKSLEILNYTFDTIESNLVFTIKK